MKLGQVLTKLRKETIYTQGEVADKINISRTYLSQIEKNRRIPTIEMIEKLAKFYKVPLFYIFYFSHEEKDLLKNNNLQVYRRLKPTIDDLIDIVFFEKKDVHDNRENT